MLVDVYIRDGVSMNLLPDSCCYNKINHIELGLN